MKRILYILLAFCAVAAASCKKADTFTVSGEVAGNPNMNVYLRYYGDGAVRTTVTAATAGHFEIKASSSEPAVVEILDNEMRVMGRLYLCNGDKVSVKLDRHNPYLIEVSGSQINQQWAEALNAHADQLLTGTPDQINRVVEAYVAEHRDNPVSSLLYVTMYDASVSPLRADSVAQSIDMAARLTGVMDSYMTTLAPYANPASYATIDSLVYRTLQSREPTVFRPSESRYSVLVLFNEQSRHRDSVVPNLKSMAESKIKRDLQIVDLALTPDTTAWRNQVRRDSDAWVRAWMPGGIFAKGVDRLAVPELPYYIVLDSAGRQIYRGTYVPIDSIVEAGR